MTVNYDLLIPAAEQHLREFQGCQEAKTVEYQGRQIVVIGDQALILFKDIEKELYTLGWSLNHKTVVVVHRHNGGDPNPLYAQCEKLNGVAKPLFSFTTPRAASERVDVMQLHPHFPHQWDSQIFSEMSEEVPTDLQVKFHSWLKTIVEQLSEQGIGIQNPLFVCDYVANKYYILPTSLGGDYSNNSAYLKSHLKEEQTVISTLHRPYDAKEWEKYTPKKIDEGLLRIGEQIMSGAFKRIFKGVLQNSEGVHPVAVSIIDVTTEESKAILELEKECAEKLNGLPNIVPILALHLHEGRLRLEMVSPLFECDLQQASAQGLLVFEDKIAVMRDAAVGVKFYQERIGVYCDLKPENILLNPNVNPISGVLTDFGGGVKKGSSSTGHCSVLYASPEMFSRLLHETETPLTEKHDSWTMGAMILHTLYFMLLDENFLEIIGNREISNNKRIALLKQWSPKIPEILTTLPPSSIKDLVRKLLHLDPAERLSMESIILELTAILQETKNYERV